MIFAFSLKGRDYAFTYMLLSFFIWPDFAHRDIPGIAEERILRKLRHVDYKHYNAILKAINRKGEVDYAKLHTFRDRLREVIHYFQSIDISTLASAEERLCLYINLYNAVVLYQVVLYYPIVSVMENFPAGNFFENLFYFRKQKISLNYLEHEIIRKEFKNPYVHFALNCASQSCPILEEVAWTPQNLLKRFQKAARRYLRDNRHAHYNSSQNKLYLSELFRWYETDFGNLREFYEKHTGQKIPPTASIEFLPYNWSLNDHKKN
ncbi:MAG: DUF547 domain-containing protein [Leptospiraceae bacterium]|nr:DUF547 domain-containing protein [Leptospiraceae bacterium]MDW8305922.1 DUF547 domain-containing protein [Leptospiraceae bacterium]